MDGITSKKLRMGRLMSNAIFFLQLPLLLHLLGQNSYAAIPIHHITPLNRTQFPPDFVFGAATAAYQIEGAALEGGKGPSIWDTFTREHPEKIWDGSNGDVAVDFYHKYKEDIKLLKDIGMDAFRFSISWTRVLPYGKVNKGVNYEGVNFYNNLINEVISQGMKPFVTIFHWDSPQTLEDEYQGWLHPNIVSDYRDYAEFCFKMFGDRVKYWSTMNEPLTFSMNAYGKGTFAPGRCSNYIANCTGGDSSTEPYIVAHNLLLAHAAAAKVYKTKYQKTQKGEIGATFVSHWFIPKLNTPEGLKAPYKALDFMLGWFLHPVTYGDYPPSMRAQVGKRLPEFTAEQAKMLTDSMDYLGINYYTTNYASPTLSISKVNLSYMTDYHVDLTGEKGGVPICPPSPLDWFFVCPKGIRSLMLYIKEKYKNPPIYITENGYAESNNKTLPREAALKDMARLNYHKSHLWYLQKAIQEGANVKGYFAWAFLDDFEWDAGLTLRFGIAYVDYTEGFKRYLKISALWFKMFLRTTPN